MSYVDANLLNGETVVHRTRAHWIHFWPLLFAVLLALLLLPLREEQPLVFLAPVALGLFFLFRGLVRIRGSEYAVTNRRVIMKEGVVRRASVEILLSKVEGILVDQGLLGRLFGYGTLQVAGTGGSRHSYTRISDPLAFRRAVQEQSERGGLGAGGPASGMDGTAWQPGPGLDRTSGRIDAAGPTGPGLTGPGPRTAGGLFPKP